MAILSAEVESNGWVLRLVMSGVAGGFADYALDPDAVPQLVLSCSHAGFGKAGGVAVPTMLARTVPVTIPLRRPVDLLDPTVPVIDETDLGGGLLAVRLTLAEHVYATDLGLTLTALAGWRTGEEAVSGIAVSNGSAMVAPIPIFRWVVPQFPVTSSLVRLSVLVGSHHPQGLDPVAGVRFAATDGTTVREVWATALDTDDSQGDGLRCHTVTLDLAGLNAGLVRCDAEIFPWLGDMRSTDTAGTRPMAGLAVQALGSAAQVPLVVGFDPEGSRYGGRWIMLDPVEGTLLASAAMVQPSLADARGVAAANKPRTLSTAIEALRQANHALPAANGGAAATRALDGAWVVLPAGISGVAGTSVASGATTSEIPLRVIGDPAVADPRADCILRSGGASPPSVRVNRIRFEGCGLEIGQASMLSSVVQMVQLDDCEVRAKAGFATGSSIVGVCSYNSPAGVWAMSAVKTRWWRAGLGLNAVNHRYGLIRACEHSRLAGGFAVVGNRFIPDSEDGTFSAAVIAYGNFAISSDIDGGEDNILAFNDARGSKDRFIQFTAQNAGVAGTPSASVRRQMLLGNVIERVGTGTQPAFSMGENLEWTMSYNIIEFNTVVGVRANFIYNDPPIVTLADADTRTNFAFVNRVANNGFDRNASKHDDTIDSTTLNIRIAAGVPNPTGYRPHLVECWSSHNGVLHEANVDVTRATGTLTGFRAWYKGVRSVQTPAPALQGHVDDRSALGSDEGLGDYRPSAGSLLLGRVRTGNTDRDLLGQPRMIGGASGAYEAAGASLALAPVPSAHDHRGGGAGLAVRVALYPAAATHGHLAGNAVAQAEAPLAPLGAVLAVRSTAPVLLLSVSMTPRPGRMLLDDTAPGLFFGGIVMIPDRGGLPLGGTQSFLTVAAAGGDARRLILGPDERVSLVRFG